jgi:N-acetyl-gamma-glutamyl-phosphate reductase
VAGALSVAARPTTGYPDLGIVGSTRSLHTYASMRESRATVTVLGASGYTGGELVRILLGHPGVTVTYLGARESAGKTLAEVQPHLAASALGSTVLAPLDDVDAVAAVASFAFCALPHGASAQIAPALVEAGLRVLDLGGDFRLPAEAYPPWYGFEHPAPAWLDKAVYGLPEWFGERIAGADLVANPGCYPTAMALGLAPLLQAGLIAPSPILVDGKTGLSGAGKSANDATIYNATEESIRPYRVPRHQHTPEMERSLALATGADPRVIFVPHLVPAVRGVLTTSYAPLTDATTTTETLTEALAARYASAPFVRVLPPGAMADSKRVRGSNGVELQAVADPRTGQAIVIGALDNLVKGAAGQAIQNLNLMLDLDEAAGLTALGMYP